MSLYRSFLFLSFLAEVEFFTLEYLESEQDLSKPGTSGASSRSLPLGPQDGYYDRIHFPEPFFETCFKSNSS